MRISDIPAPPDNPIWIATPFCEVILSNKGCRGMFIAGDRQKQSQAQVLKERKS